MLPMEAGPGSFSFLPQSLWCVSDSLPRALLSGYVNVCWCRQLLATSMRSTFGLLFGEFLQDIQADPVSSSLIFNVTQTVWFTACQSRAPFAPEAFGGGSMHSVSLFCRTGLFVGSMCTVFSHRRVVLVGGSLIFLGMFSTVFVTSATQMLFSYSLFTGAN